MFGTTSSHIEAIKQSPPVCVLFKVTSLLLIVLILEFKTLTYNGFFVDVSKLDQGIYISEIPTLYKRDTTIYSIIESYSFLHKDYIENLGLCTLENIEIVKN